jgi:hypothetical protein
MKALLLVDSHAATTARVSHADARFVIAHLARV